MNPNSAADKLLRISDALRRNIVSAEDKTLRQAKAVALKLSSGSLTPVDMRRMGHPYAARGFSVRSGTSANPEVINDNGPFKGDWRTSGPNLTSGRCVSVLWNIDRNARFFGGTVNMVPRPIRAAIITAVRRDRASRLRKALASSLKA
jgi:hypothetical protein